VVGDVYDRIFIGARRIVEPELVRIGKGVGDGHGQVSRIAFLAVLAEIRQLQGRVTHRLRLPDGLVETLYPAVQGVRAVVW
jgi:hypothetical protein